MVSGKYGDDTHTADISKKKFIGIEGLLQENNNKVYFSKGDITIIADPKKSELKKLKGMEGYKNLEERFDFQDENVEEVKPGDMTPAALTASTDNAKKNVKEETVKIKKERDEKVKEASDNVKKAKSKKQKKAAIYP